jgi:agmatinase
METFLGCDKTYEQADTVIFGAPFDSTTSYRPGTRFGSRTMRAESYALETYSPYLDRDIEDKKVCDLGELELCFGDTQTALSAIETQTAKILADGKRPVMIGGEHLVSLGAIRAAAARYPDLHIIHFDAHTDLRDNYLGASLSHAAVIRRAWDILGDGRIYQFGIRSGDRSEFRWAAEGHVQMSKFGFDGLKETVLRLMDKPVYFTLDLDVLDPSVFPGTGTPEPGGVTFMQLLEAVYEVCRLHIVAADLCELAPVYDPSGASTAVALKLLREMLLAM